MAIENHIPRSTIRSFLGKPEWYNGARDIALNKKFRTWRHYKANKATENRFRYNQTRNTYTYIARKAMTEHKARMKKITTGLKKDSSPKPHLRHQP